MNSTEKRSRIVLGGSSLSVFASIGEVYIDQHYYDLPEILDWFAGGLAVIALIGLCACIPLMIQEEIEMDKEEKEK